MTKELNEISLSLLKLSEEDAITDIKKCITSLTSAICQLIDLGVSLGDKDLESDSFIIDLRNKLCDVYPASIQFDDDFIDDDDDLDESFEEFNEDENLDDDDDDMYEEDIWAFRVN